ncbi:hypothetical protein QR721_03335 [Aciduricibacillus chroicocephali]|uniref:DUF3592 domain-containing protein n=1 Tax=Aciduricibacillus chroicocephali TaxID=3054939 RepID=A0ABY9L0C3_9BACI|nr:hypothetical protein QR721_03335 [Bacillaceae bacterium 44XB]
MKKILRVIGRLIALILFFLACWGSAWSLGYMHSVWEDGRQQPEEHKVEEKTVLRTRSGVMTYLALFDKEAAREVFETLEPSRYAYVSASQFKQLRPGDSIDVRKIKGEYSATSRTFISDLATAFFLVVLILLYPVFYLAYLLDKWVVTREVIARVKPLLLWTGIILPFSLFALFCFFSLLGGIQTIFSVSASYTGTQMEKEAVILDSYSYIDNSGRLTVHYYYKAIVFQDESAGDVYMTKGMSREEFETHKITLPVAYQEGKPLDLHVRDSETHNLWYYLYDQSDLVGSLLGLLFLSFYGFLFWEIWRLKKGEHRNRKSKRRN